MDVSCAMCPEGTPRQRFMIEMAPGPDSVAWYLCIKHFKEGLRSRDETIVQLPTSAPPPPPLLVIPPIAEPTPAAPAKAKRSRRA